MLNTSRGALDNLALNVIGTGVAKNLKLGSINLGRNFSEKSSRQCIGPESIPLVFAAETLSCLEY